MKNINRVAINGFVLLGILGAISACGGGGSSGTTPTNNNPSPRPASIELIHYDPVGNQDNPEINPLPATSTGAGVTVSNLENITHGFLSGFNTDVRPTLMGVGPLDVANSFYIKFTITPDDPALGVFVSSLTYDYLSYSPGATGTISLRTSADAFATTLDSKAWVGDTASTGVVTLTFDASSMAVVQGPLEVRLYMHDLVGGFVGQPAGFPDPADWADLVSSAATGDGLRVQGGVATPGS